MKKTIIALAIGLTTLTLSNVEVSANEKEKTKVNEYIEVIEYGDPAKVSLVNPEVMEFVKEIAPYAYEVGNTYGIYPSVTIAQAILESAVGKSKLAQHPNNNLFGVKGSYKGQSVDFKTLEDDGSGSKFTINADFKKYPSKFESLQDHGSMLRERLNGFYKGVWRENTYSYKDATAFLQGRYATDTSYASKLNSLIETYNLTRFDSKLDEYDFEWLESNSLDPWERKWVLADKRPELEPIEELEKAFEPPLGFQEAPQLTEK